MAIFKSTDARRNLGKDAQGVSSPNERAKARLRRAAYVQPRLLLAGMVMILAGSTWWAVAQGADTKDSAKPNTPKTLKFSDLPALMEAYGQRKADAAEAAKAKLSGRNLSKVGNHRYALTEVDITPNTPSDEREPAFSPNGDYIAFTTNGRDTNSDGFIDTVNSDGKYHIWVMLRNGRGQRQVTGFGTDSGRNQGRPAWSPDGNQLVYVDTTDNIFSSSARTTSQLYVARPFDSTTGGVVPTEQRTFFVGFKDRPSWNSSGLKIAFSSTVDARLSGSTATTPASIYTISPSGSRATALRITGDPTADPIGQITSDWNPCYSRINQEVLFFSSDRQVNNAGVESKLTNGGRRIWMVNTTTLARRQVTDPSSRASTQDFDSATYVDDFPATSATAPASPLAMDFKERVAFQSNTLLNVDDKNDDLNVWSILVNTASTVSQTPPALLVGDANSGQGGLVASFSPTTGEYQENAIEPNSSGLMSPKGLLFTGDFVGGDGFNDLLVANSPVLSNSATLSTGDVRLFNGATYRLDRVFAAGGGLTYPTALTYGPDGALYVSSGHALSTASPVKSSNKVHRFGGGSGTLLPATPGGTARTGSEFTDGTGVTNGVEGIAFGPSLDGDSVRDLFVSSYTDNRINVYSGVDGKYINGTTALPEAYKNGFITGLNRPTGITFSPDGNTLYVANSGTSEILSFNPRTGVANGPFATGSPNGLSTPEGLVFGADGQLYVSNDGRVTRYASDGSNSPAPGLGGATFSASPNPLRGSGYLAFNPTANTTIDTSTAPLEETQPIALESNAISSLSTFKASALCGANDELCKVYAVEDKVADQEPSFGSNGSTRSLVAQLAFASQRTHAPAPSGDVANGTPNEPVIVNPAPGGFAANDNDIWTTASQDFVPPILVAQGTGNDQTPFIAPGTQSPFYAPRTPEEGLVPGGKVKIAFVLKEPESGMQSASLKFRNADKPTFVTKNDFVNEGIRIQAMREEPPSVVTGNNSGGAATSYDDGPVSQGGHELQAGAVKQDGIYYCSAELTTPAIPGDFYIDLEVWDNANNGFDYDHVWGFSTRTFQKALGLNDLFVSDYTVGQYFPRVLFNEFVVIVSNGDLRYYDQDPVESYWLTNNGDAFNDVVNKDAVSGAVDPTTFKGVNTWRILCRGAVPTEVYDSFSPGSVNQYDPESFKGGRPAGFPATVAGATGTFPAKTKVSAVAKSAIIWASPYTGTVFAGPGTLIDPSTQTKLTNFLNKGGRLFVSGRDVIYSLSNQGTLQNNFLKNDLQASFTTEGVPPTRTIQAAAGFFDFAPFGDYSHTLQFPYNQLDNPDPSKRTDTYVDAAWNQDYIDNDYWISKPDYTTYSTPIGFDYIGTGSGGSGVNVIPAYTADGGKTVGQRIEKTRSNGIESRVVFFSFGFEGINRRYHKPDTTVPLFAINVRPKIAAKIQGYFHTGGFSGRVTNANTNLPVPNYLLQVIGNGREYVVATDENGFYEITGLSSGGYTIKPGTYQSGTTTLPLNPGWQTTTTLSDVIDDGEIETDNNFRIIPVPQGSISGTAVKSTGIGSVATTPMENSYVLLRSVSESSAFPGGGKYTQLLQTDAGGRFTFANVPPGVPMELVFNPDVADVPTNSPLHQTYEDAGGPDLSFGKRTIPDRLRPDAISAPGGETFIVNDLRSDLSNPVQTIPADTVDEDNLPIIVPFGVTVSGNVLNSINGVESPVVGATVTLTAPGSGGQVYSTTTDSNGFYYFYDVPPLAAPAVYKLKVYPDDPELVREPKVPVAVRRSAGYVVETIYYYRQDVTGTVKITRGTPATDDPAAGAKVTLKHPTNGTNLETTADVNGEYKFTNVKSDAKVYTVYGELDQATDKQDVLVKDGLPAVADLKLKLRGIQGTVRLNNQPIEGASIYLDGNDTGVKSDANGKFGLPNTTPGKHSLAARYSSEPTDTMGDQSTPMDVTVTADAAITPTINLYLEGITGTVNLEQTGSTTGPVLNAEVFAKRSDGYVYKSVKTGPDGKYTITGLSAGNYTVSALYKDDTSDSVTVPTLIRDGSTKTAPILLVRLRRVAGKVTANGVPTTTATVVLLKNNVQVATMTSSGAGGTFAFNGISAGTYVLRASQATSVSPDVTVTFTRTADPAAVELKLSIVNVSGHVTVNGLATGGLPVTLTKAGTEVASTTTLADGSYGFGQVGPGNYRATSTTGAGGDTAFRDFTVTAGSNVVVPDIALLLQTVRGTVTVAGVPTAGLLVELLNMSGGVTTTTRATTTTTSTGTYAFTGVPAGLYTVRATASGAPKNSAVVTVTRTGGNVDVATINFQSISGQVTLNGSPSNDNIIVKLYSGTTTSGTLLGSGPPDGAGKFRFLGTYSGSYTLQAVRGGDQVARTITVQANQNGTVDLPLVTTGPTPTPTPTAPPTPTPTPTPTPDPSTEDYQIGKLYEISVPYTDDANAYSTTTVAKAFPLLPKETVNGTVTQNYTLRRFDALTQAYVQLDSGTDIIKRGEGYFLRPLTRAFSMRKPVTTPTPDPRVPTTATTFDIVLRKNPSLDPRAANNGYNLIGFPFNPATYSNVSWLNASVTLPDGRTFDRVIDAFNAGVMSKELTTLKTDGTETYEDAPNMAKFKGYYVKTFVDGAVVRLKNPE